jgi:hypothetical protein
MKIPTIVPKRLVRGIHRYTAHGIQTALQRRCERVQTNREAALSHALLPAQQLFLDRTHPDNGNHIIFDRFIVLDLLLMSAGERHPGVRNF